MKYTLYEYMHAYVIQSIESIQVHIQQAGGWVLPRRIFHFSAFIFHDHNMKKTYILHE